MASLMFRSKADNKFYAVENTPKCRGTWYVFYYDMKGKKVRQRIGSNKHVAELAKGDIEAKLEKQRAGLLDPDKELKRITLATFKERLSDFLQTENKAPKTIKRYCGVLKNLCDFISSSDQCTKSFTGVNMGDIPLKTVHVWIKNSKIKEISVKYCFYKFKILTTTPFVLLLIGFSVFACSNEKNTITGIYTANLENISSMLQLNSDYSYNEYITSGTIQVKINSSHYEFDGQYLTLKDFVMPHSLEQKHLILRINNYDKIYIPPNDDSLHNASIPWLIYSKQKSVTINIDK